MVDFEKIVTVSDSFYVRRFLRDDILHYAVYEPSNRHGSVTVLDELGVCGEVMSRPIPDNFFEGTEDAYEQGLMIALYRAWLEDLSYEIIEKAFPETKGVLRFSGRIAHFFPELELSEC